MVEIKSKIVKVEVVKPENNIKEELPKTINMTRPKTLRGSTYKLKTPLCDAALYITINDIVIDDVIYPFEIFINSKSTDHFDWIVALTRVISAIFRNNVGKRNTLHFLLEELASVYSPSGGYLSKGKKIPSLVTEISYIIEEHLKIIGNIDSDENMEISVDIQKKISDNNDNNEVLKGAKQCPNCNKISLVLLEGCQTCLQCGYSKCG
jgi:hypothetical protein